jgi:hypothetical protein
MQFSADGGHCCRSSTEPTSCKVGGGYFTVTAYFQYHVADPAQEFNLESIAAK